MLVNWLFENQDDLVAHYNTPFTVKDPEIAATLHKLQHITPESDNLGPTNLFHNTRLQEAIKRHGITQQAAEAFTLTLSAYPLEDAERPRTSEIVNMAFPAENPEVTCATTSAGADVNATATTRRSVSKMPGGSGGLTADPDYSAPAESFFPAAYEEMRRQRTRADRKESQSYEASDGSSESEEETSSAPEEEAAPTGTKRSVDSSPPLNAQNPKRRRNSTPECLRPGWPQSDLYPQVVYQLKDRQYKLKPWSIEEPEIDRNKRLAEVVGRKRRQEKAMEAHAIKIKAMKADLDADEKNWAKYNL